MKTITANLSKCICDFNDNRLSRVLDNNYSAFEYASNHFKPIPGYNRIFILKNKKTQDDAIYAGEVVAPNGITVYQFKVAE